MATLQQAPAAPRPAGGAGIITKNSPPLVLPGEHFAAALAFFLAGAAGLVWVAPDVAQGLFPMRRVVAVTHLFTLGWITTTIQGALYQFLPVALGVSIRSRRAAHLSFALYVPGVAIFVGGLLAGAMGVVAVGAALFATGLLVFLGNLAASLARAEERNLTWWALSGASLFLFTTIVLGGLLAGNLGLGYLGAHRFLTMGVHLHVAALGWVMLVIVGVAHRLLPMFLVSHGAPERPAWLALAFLAAGAAGLLALEAHLSPIVLALVATLLAAGVVSFLVQALLFFRHRKKPSLDPGLRLAATALFFLVGALVLAPLFLVNGLAAPRLATAYVLALILGGLALFVAGIYYKILPFLIWFHRFGPLAGKRKLPKVGDLYSARRGNLAATLLALGVLGLLLATLTATTLAARPAAALFALGAVLLVTQMFAISRRRPE